MGQLLSVPLPPNENLDPPLFISSFISFNPNNQHVKFERKCIKSSISMEVSWDDLSMHSFKNFESGTDEKQSRICWVSEKRTIQCDRKLQKFTGENHMEQKFPGRNSQTIGHWSFSSEIQINMLPHSSWRSKTVRCTFKRKDSWPVLW